MKALVMTDLEGVSGCVYGGFGRTVPPAAMADQLALMMGEINAVVEGCVQAGIEEIVVDEAHPVDLASLHPAAKLARGIPAHAVLDLRPFDAVLFVGQHARTGLANAVRAHTGSSNSITGFWINGRPAGELGYFGGLAGSRGVPVIFLSGDTAACAEAREWVEGPVVTVEVEESHNLHGALCLPPARVHPLLIAGVREAFARRDRIPPIRIPPPITFTTEFRQSRIADEYCLIPGTRREGPRTVSFTGQTWEDTWRGGMAVLASVLYKYDA